MNTDTETPQGKKARWYIVHTYSGFEQRVEQTVREMMRTGQDNGLIEEVVVPTEKVVELVKGEKRTSTRKFYPGYVMIKMVMEDESRILSSQSRA
jgi:transcriptional antiterminator NusG